MEILSSLNQRDKAILVGLFLSRFDKEALNGFNFKGFNEAYNVLGYALDIRPNSIKNYRNEFDPYFPNSRKDRHKRDIRDYCKEIILLAESFSFDDFYRYINSFVLNECVDVKDLKSIHRINKEQAFAANRLITGKAAEEYFKKNYQAIDCFKNFKLIDTTNWGCGFDYKLFSESENFYIEVKDVNEKVGNVLMTEKEYNMADGLQERYCLFIVSNFKERPMHQLFFNPLHHKEIILTKKELQIIQTSYVGNIIRP